MNIEGEKRLINTHLFSPLFVKVYFYERFI